MTSCPASKSWQLRKAEHFEAPPMKETVRTFSAALTPGTANVNRFNSLMTSYDASYLQHGQHSIEPLLVS